MNTFRYLKIAAIAAAVLMAACRGQKSEVPPVHPNMNMDQQHRMEAQEENAFFSDNRGMRQPVEGTVSRGGLRQDKSLYQGINEDSSFVKQNPIEITRKFLLRGQDRFDVFCTPCHGIAGDGKGVIATGGYGLVPPPSYHIDRLRNVNDGYLYSVISNGIRTMRPYAHQIPVKDRWAIVSYIRALQRSQHVPESDMQKYNIDLASMKEEAQQKIAAEQKKKESEESAGGAEITAAKGEQLAQTNTCTTCHSADGSELTGPTWKGLYGKQVELADGSTVTADEDYLTESIVNSTAKTVKGYPEGAMADFSYLSSNDVKNIVAYIKSLSDKSPQEEMKTEPKTETEAQKSSADEPAESPETESAKKNAAQSESDTKAAVDTVRKSEQKTENGPEPLSASANSGKMLIQKFECLSCHYIDDTEGGLAPSFKGLFGKARELEGGAFVVADAGYIKDSIQYPNSNIALGYNNNMPSYRDLLSDPDLQAITDYIKTLR